MIDADAQQSSSKWLSKMENPIAYQLAQDPDKILDVVPILKNDYIILDGPASLSENTRAILLRTDLAIIPFDILTDLKVR